MSHAFGHGTTAEEVVDAFAEHVKGRVCAYAFRHDYFNN